MGIKHEDVKASRDQGYASEWNKNHIIDDDVEFDQNQPLDMVIENRTDFPAGPVEGQIIYRTDLNALYVFNGTSWVISGLTNKTSYWSCNGYNFTASEPSTQVVVYTLGIATIGVGGATLRCPIFLPEGSIVTACIVYGNVGMEDEIWRLLRVRLADADTSTAMSSMTAINTEDTTITHATIDNSTYGYYIDISTALDGDKVYGARITYTTDYD